MCPVVSAAQRQDCQYTVLLRQDLPVGALHVGLALHTRGATPLLGDAVIGFEGEIEVSVAVVLTVVTEDEDDWASVVELRSGYGHRGQAGEEHLWEGESECECMCQSGRHS